MSSYFPNRPGNGRHPTGICFAWILAGTGRNIVFRRIRCITRQIQYCLMGVKRDSAYALIGEYATPQEALAQCRIQGMPLGDILEDESTELLGQD